MHGAATGPVLRGRATPISHALGRKVRGTVPRDGDPLNGDTIMTKILAAFLVLGLAIAAGAPVASAAQPAYQHNGTTFDGGNG